MAQPVDEYAIMLNPWFGQYTDASFEQQQAEVSLALTAASRAAALAKLHDDGWSLAAIAEACGLTRTRVCQLIARDRRARAAVSVSASRRKMCCANCGGVLPGGCGCGDDDDDDDDGGE